MQPTACEWGKWKPVKRPGRRGAQKLEERGDRCILCRVHYLRPCQAPVAPNPRCFSRQAQCPWRTHEAAFQKPAKNPGRRGAAVWEGEGGSPPPPRKISSTSIYWLISILNPCINQCLATSLLNIMKLSEGECVGSHAVASPQPSS